MYRGLLLYNSSDAKKNRWFISELINRAGEFDIELSLYEGALDAAFPGLLSGKDLVLNRCRDLKVNRLCKESGIVCINNEQTVRIGNNKWENYLFCVENDIPVIETVLVNEGASLPDLPFVMKELSGHGGHEVYWIDSAEKYERLLNKPKKRFIAQRAVSERTKDLRIYMMGDRVITCILRSSRDDFRSNFSRGGQIELFEPDHDLTGTAKKVQKLLDSDFIGIDFIWDNDRWYLNEIEDAVGSRMVYQLTDIDVAELYLEQAGKRLNNSYDK